MRKANITGDFTTAPPKRKGCILKKTNLTCWLVWDRSKYVNVASITAMWRIDRRGSPGCHCATISWILSLLSPCALRVVDFALYTSHYTLFALYISRCALQRLQTGPPMHLHHLKKRITIPTSLQCSSSRQDSLACVILVKTKHSGSSSEL